MSRPVMPGAGGRSSANASPSLTRTGRRISIVVRGASCSTIPAQSSRNTNGAAEPSRIGGSGPSTSTTALSMPQPASAAITCSTVPIRAPSLSASTVARRVSTTRSKRAGMSTPRSVRRNTMPWSAGAGRKVRLTRLSGCSPTPTQPIGAFSVCWHHVVSVANQACGRPSMRLVSLRDHAAMRRKLVAVREPWPVNDCF